MLVPVEVLLEVLNFAIGFYCVAMVTVVPEFSKYLLMAFFSL